MINFIQQIGIGVFDIDSAFRWIRIKFRMDIPIFNDKGEPVHMIRHTGGHLQKRHAILAASLQGGSGFEIWQYTSRMPEPPVFPVKIGDLGILIAKIKAHDIQSAFSTFKERGIQILGCISKDPADRDHFFIKDPFGNIFQIIRDEHRFSREKWVTGGVCGCIIGVSDIEKSLPLYKDILGYDKVLYNKTESFEDLGPLPGGKEKIKRVLLTTTREPKGAFSRLVGPSQIELVQMLKNKPRKIFDDRFWGDLGFIHLCFDVHDMMGLEKECAQKGFPFTVDSPDPFNMGGVECHFSYIEDPDGTLIEFVETYKIPTVKKLGWYLDLKKRDPEKPLPNWMIKLLSLSRVKD